MVDESIDYSKNNCNVAFSKFKCLHKKVYHWLSLEKYLRGICIYLGFVIERFVIALNKLAPLSNRVETH